MSKLKIVTFFGEIQSLLSLAPQKTIAQNTIKKIDFISIWSNEFAQIKIWQNKLSNPNQQRCSLDLNWLNKMFF